MLWRKKSNQQCLSVSGTKAQVSGSKGHCTTGVEGEHAGFLPSEAGAFLQAFYLEKS